MKEYKHLWRKVVLILQDCGVNLGQLPVRIYNDPSVVFYGDIPEERSDIHVIVEGGEFTDTEELAEHLYATMYTLREGLSVRLLDDYEELTQDVLRMFDHLYGVMVQQAARQKKPDSGYRLDIGLLTVETKLPLLEQTRFVGRNVLLNLGQMAKALFEANPVSATKKKWEAFERGARLLMPAPNLHIIDTVKREGINPFHNFDMRFGGLLGWYRFECATKQVAPGFEIMHDSLRPGWRDECRQALAEDLDEFEAAVSSFRRVIENEKKDRIGELIADTRRLYEL